MAQRHYHYADFLFYMQEPARAEHRMIERHVVMCDSCRRALAQFIKLRIEEADSADETERDA